MLKMGSKEASNNLLPGMPVFIRDASKVWEEGTVTITGKNTCTVALINKKVLIFIRTIQWLGEIMVNKSQHHIKHIVIPGIDHLP